MYSIDSVVPTVARAVSSMTPIILQSAIVACLLVWSQRNMG